jgi:integrase
MPDITLARSNPRTPLTAVEVARLKPPPEGRLVVRDPGCRGLALRITSTNVRTWSLEVKVDGRQRRFSIGDAASMTLAEARKKAAGLRVRVLEEGADPVEERRERRRQVRLRRAGAADTGTITGLLDSFERLKAKPAGLRSWNEMRGLIEHNFREYLDKAPAELTRSDIRAVLDAAVSRGAPISGKRASRYLGRVFSWAVERELVPANPMAGVDLDELTVAERPRQRVLSDDELRAVWRAALEAGSPFGDLCRLYLLTGLRREEAAAMKWSDFDAAGVLTLGATKSDQPHRLPLPAAAVEIIWAQPKRGDHVFTLRTGSPVAGRTTNWHRENQKLATTAGTAPWTWHDLRRSCRTLLARIGVDDLVAELILNHALPGKLRRTYNLHKYEGEMLAALEQLAGFIDQVVEGKANVVKLPRGGRQAVGQ